MKSLEQYEISPERGYLCQFDADKVDLFGDLRIARDVAMELPRYIPSGRVRSLLLANLPRNDLAEALNTCDDAQARLSMVHYSFMVQAWIWGQTEPSDSLPACLAKPIVTLADRLGQQPLLPYSGYVLDNWGRFDPDGPIDLDNVYMIQNFLSGMDEAWFVLIHVAIEAKAGGVLARMPKLVEAAAQGNENQATQLLEEMAMIWSEINAIFDRMPERCDPYMYFNRVRPYIHGWKDNPALPNGVIYEGVARYSKGKTFRGQTGSQSSIVPAMDSLMGVGHAADPMKEYLDQLHIYRPPAHRAFIDDLRKESTLRDFVGRAQNPNLIEAYNANIQAVADFRSRHLEYAASYINKQALDGQGNHTDVGTGGTPFMRYLKKHRDETRERLLPLPVRAMAI